MLLLIGIPQLQKKSELPQAGELFSLSTDGRKHTRSNEAGSIFMRRINYNKRNVFFGKA
jgi:hypothetical protein